MINQVTLVIFTCEGREHLLNKSYPSFLAACDYRFDKVILAADGQINSSVFTNISPDVTIYHHTRRGYVNSISKALKLIDTPYFFWLEDDWVFHKNFDLRHMTNLLITNQDWCQVLFSQWFPLKPEYKVISAGNGLYQTPFGFSANPCLCNTAYIQSAFLSLENSPKGDNLGEHGFENYLTDYFKQISLKSIIIDPGNSKSISHDGYLESTPRSWHMTNSLIKTPDRHLLTLSKPPIWRRLLMMLKLTFAFFKLMFKQLVNNEAYEFSFRIIATLKSMYSVSDD